ncbi:1,4-alpha-glucan branching protein [Streptomyces sp. NPDC006274]|uniref:maltokinase N-terminal cap-like domain-containing protein n=1 Tax=unclassified Streptomyces TaxID=2593676 RepID=UPI00339FA90F
MAVIHRTTLSPGKLELLSAWLPTRPWYLGTGGEPVLAKAGGFRLDDPQGEVGIEFMVVTDVSGDEPVAYHVPLSYRAAPLAGADAGADEAALVGTSEHGMLGKRWVYDGSHDPVVVERLLALAQGRAEAQAQSESDTPDPSVTVHFTGPGLPSVTPGGVTDGPAGTTVALAPEPLTLQVTRVLRPTEETAPGTAARGHITATWHLPDGTDHRARFFTLHDASPR